GCRPSAPARSPSAPLAEDGRQSSETDFWLGRDGSEPRLRRRLRRDRAVDADQFRRLDRPGGLPYLGAFRLQGDVKIQVKGLLSSANLHIASFERLLAR